MNIGYINHSKVSSRHTFIVFSSIRGILAERWTLHAAYEEFLRDYAQHGLSDASVFKWSQAGWLPFDIYSLSL